VCIHSLKRILVVTLGLALLITAVPPLLAQNFEAQEVDAVLGPERDPDNTNKVPPMWEAIRTADGKVRVIVQLSDPAVALYKGGMAARPAISPKATGRTKLDMAAKQTKQYRRFLATRQKQARQRVQQVAPSARTFRRYSVVFNGMSMAVNENEIAAIAALPEVARVYPDKMYYATMDASLPLIQAPEFWAELGGRDTAGEGIKVAVVDGGIRPEHPMFDGTGFDFPPGYPLADDYCGAVDPSFCNGKLIVARHFRSVPLHPAEFDSPLGANGHGTHVSGSAVGNFVAGATAPDGVPEDLSGVAPGAWLMAYKALWWNGTTGSGSTTDLIDALEAAVADGADVINNSWGGPGGEDPNTDAFNAVFEAIRAAGVVSVTAAGNAGPGARSVGCPGCQPPTLTVANSTTNRLHALGFDITETGGPTGNACLEGTGPTLGAPVGPQPVVYSGDVGDFEGCSAFPAGSMTGAIALISRGSCSFATKVLNAEAAGAIFTVVFNNVGGAPITMGGLNAGEAISSCMISNDQGIVVRDFVQANLGAEGLVNYPAQRLTNDAFQDDIASSSSRGPNGDADFLKPDVAAPGTRIMSAWSVDHPTGGSEYILINGTSMASPHVAGAAALMLQKHPDWTPDQVKSAIMSTAVRGLVKEDAVTPADPFDLGAGRVDLDRARRAGATFDQASMAEDLCFLGCSFTRTIQNELPYPADWMASVESTDPDLLITVTPSTVMLQPGESMTFQVDVDTTLVDQGQWHFGGVIWGGGFGSDVPDAYLPIAVFAAASTDAVQLTKNVDKPVAPQNDRLTYDITLTNLTLTESIDLVDAIPDGTTYVPGSAQALIDGVPDSGFVFDAGSNSLSWSGMLDALTLEVVPSTSPFGYLPLDLFFAPLGCSSVCDDTSISLSGFSFEYAGETYTDVVMSSNGFLVAGDDATDAFSPSNQNLPDAATPNNVIAPFWTDIDMDGTSASDSGAGIWYAGILTDGVNDFLIMEWQGVELFGVPGPTYTFQVWIQLGSSSIWFVYDGIPSLPTFLTVGAEDIQGAAGTSYFFDGAGTPPEVGADLLVSTMPGSTAEFTFQVDTSCSLEPVVNIVDVTSGDTSIFAFAVTEMVFGVDDDGDGVPDECGDLCLGTVIPESVPTIRLRPNRYALVDEDLVFDSVGNGERFRFTTTDTAGCSCEQIIDAWGLGKGHTKFGCSLGIMRNWIDSVSP
jgi:uncharacterized repeat protein (TIGR01451 family)